MNQILYPRNKQKMKVITIIVIILILLIAAFLGLGTYSQNSNKFLKGVSINSIDISGKTREEAMQVLKEQQASLDSLTYVLAHKNREIVLSGDEIDLHYDTKAIDIAYTYGRDGNLFENSLTALKSLFNAQYDVPVNIDLDKDILNEKIAVLLEDEKDFVKDDSYEILDNEIVVEKGHDSVVANIPFITEKMVEAASGASSKIDLAIDTNVESAQRVDFDKLYEIVFVEKANAECVEEESGEVEYKEEIIGISFDKEKAKEDYSNLKAGETLKIALIEDEPEITTENLEDVLFGDVLATYKTNYIASNVDRSTNLEVAARNINGTIILPGEEFSYNKEVGQRTYANGFKDAHIFSGGKVVDGLGGGICQISSTLYNAVLMADLEVVERKNHMMYPEYVKPSLDATVVWGSIDFRFKNNRETPIKIVATVKNGVATTTIYGKKSENEPIIEIESVIEKTIPYTTVTEYDKNMDEGTTVVTQSPVNGYVSKAYRIEKDKDGNEISKTLISSDTYKQTSKIVTVGTKKVEKPVEVVTPTEPEASSDNNQSGNNENDWPTGWDTPENPYYQGN